MIKEWLDNFKKSPEFKIYVIVIALLALWLVFGVLTDGIFLSARNISNLFRQMTIISFLALGMAFVIISKNIDISVGSVAGFTSMIAALLQAIWLPPVLSKVFQGASLGIASTIITILLTIIAGSLIGLIHGAMIAYGGVPSFVVTLGGMFLWRGAILGVSNSQTITPIEDSLRDIAQGYLSKPLGWIITAICIAIIILNVFLKRRKWSFLGFANKSISKDLLKVLVPIIIILGSTLIMSLYEGIPNPVLLMIIVYVVLSFIMNNTTFGLYVFAIGGNIQSAELCGINTKKTVLKIYILMGLLASISGIVMTGYVAAGTVSGGLMFEMIAIASCVIGGISIHGGEGAIVGALIGCLFMASLDNGMSIMNMGAFWQYIVKGLVLVIAVFWDVKSKKKLS